MNDWLERAMNAWSSLTQREQVLVGAAGATTRGVVHAEHCVTESGLSKVHAAHAHCDIVNARSNSLSNVHAALPTQYARQYAVHAHDTVTPRRRWSWSADGVRA